jgi:hypothetical protein
MKKSMLLVLLFGMKIVVTNGFYKDCTGLITGKNDGQDKYYVELECKRKSHGRYYTTDTDQWINSQDLHND